MSMNDAVNGFGNFIGEQAGRYDRTGATYTDKIIGGAMSGFEFMRQAGKSGNIDAAFANVFREGGKIGGKVNYGKVGLAAVGTMGALRGTYGAIKGAFTDGQGNIDLPGIPFF